MPSPVTKMAIIYYEWPKLNIIDQYTWYLQLLRQHISNVHTSE